MSAKRSTIGFFMKEKKEENEIDNTCKTIINDSCKNQNECKEMLVFKMGKKKSSFRYFNRIAMDIDMLTYDIIKQMHCK